jgi:archaellum component FlaC
MYRRYNDLEGIQQELHSAEAELEELKEQIQSFERVVEARLGEQLDQISDLNMEIASLNETLLSIRDQRLYGEDRMRYQDGAPITTPAPLAEEVSPKGIPLRRTEPSAGEVATQDNRNKVPELKELYRKLARMYHPDLARSESDRRSLNDQMTRINQMYARKDISGMKRLAGLTVLPDLESNWISPDLLTPKLSDLSEAEQAQARLKSIRQEITTLSSLPSVKLSLEVKLARHQGRDLLNVMAMDLRFKVARKMAERDYLRAQIKTSQG